MPSIIDVCNKALSTIGTRSTISALTEGSIESNLCSLWYDCTRQSLLRVHPWSFARRQVPLSLLAAAAGTPENPTGATPRPMAPWNYEYAWPADCLRVRQIFQPVANGPAIPFLLSGDLDAAGNNIKVVLTNQSQASLIYTADITNPDIWDSEFEDAVVSGLAAALVAATTGDKALIAELNKAAQGFLLLARTTDSTESGSTQEVLPDWLATRGYPATDTSGYGASDGGLLANIGLINATLS